MYRPAPLPEPRVIGEGGNGVALQPPCIPEHLYSVHFMDGNLGRIPDAKNAIGKCFKGNNKDEYLEELSTMKIMEGVDPTHEFHPQLFGSLALQSDYYATQPPAMLKAIAADDQTLAGGVYELVEEGAGEQILKSDFIKLPFHQQLKAISRILGQLNGMHTKQVVHGDLHYGNIMWNGSKNRIMLIDFGLMRHTTDFIDQFRRVRLTDYHPWWWCADTLFNKALAKGVDNIAKGMQDRNVHWAPIIRDWATNHDPTAPNGSIRKLMANTRISDFHFLPLLYVLAGVPEDEMWRQLSAGFSQFIDKLLQPGGEIDRNLECSPEQVMAAADQISNELAPKFDTFAIAMSFVRIYVGPSVPVSSVGRPIGTNEQHQQILQVLRPLINLNPFERGNLKDTAKLFAESYNALNPASASDRPAKKSKLFLDAMELAQSDLSAQELSRQRQQLDTHDDEHLERLMGRRAARQYLASRGQTYGLERPYAQAGRALGQAKPRYISPGM